MYYSILGSLHIPTPLYCCYFSYNIRPIIPAIYYTQYTYIHHHGLYEFEDASPWNQASFGEQLNRFAVKLFCKAK
jgi:hypothetical protein